MVLGRCRGTARGGIGGRDEAGGKERRVGVLQRSCVCVTVPTQQMCSSYLSANSPSNIVLNVILEFLKVPRWYQTFKTDS